MVGIELIETINPIPT